MGFELMQAMAAMRGGVERLGSECISFLVETLLFFESMLPGSYEKGFHEMQAIYKKLFLHFLKSSHGN